MQHLSFAHTSVIRAYCQLYYCTKKTPIFLSDDSEEELSESSDSSSTKSSVNFRVNKFAKSISVVEGEDLRVECKITLVTNSTIDIKKDLVFKWYKYKIAEDTDSYVGTLGNCSEENQDTQHI